MTQAIAFDSGEFLPAERLSIPVYDSGFMLGATISDQLRTFGGKLFAVERHLARLQRSLHILGLDPGLSTQQIAEAATEVSRHNHDLLANGDDLACAVLISPGANTAMAPPREDRPRVRIHTYPLPFSQWHRNYEDGVALSVPAVRQTPANCWPPELKCRSRMHYYLADRQAKAIDPSSRAIMLDQEGYVLEATTANVLLFHESEGIISPPLEDILHGVSLNTLEQLARQLSIPFRYRRIQLEELEKATEIFLCSTSPCVWPVAKLNGKSIGRLGSDTVAGKLLDAWSALVGINISKQVLEFSNRKTSTH